MVWIQGLAGLDTGVFALHSKLAHSADAKQQQPTRAGLSLHLQTGVRSAQNPTFPER